MIANARRRCPAGRRSSSSGKPVDQRYSLDRELVSIAGGDPLSRSPAGLAKDRIVTSEQVNEHPTSSSDRGVESRYQGRIAGRPGWQDVPAVRNGQIYEVKSTYILNPGGTDRGVAQLHDIIRRVTMER
jgi:iron complex transport system substrate-binding protein